MNIKSKNRVREFGEVFTAQDEINGMLDLVRDESYRIDSRFLEPACGNGNFLANVLSRKFEVIKKEYCKVKLDFERYTLLAIFNLYGIDIQLDNVEECRKRLYKLVFNLFSECFPNDDSKDFLEVVDFILSKNILWGDALTLKIPNQNNPIVFSEWSFIKGSLVKRREFLLSTIFENKEINATPLFQTAPEDIYIPSPSRVFKTVHFYDLVHEK